MGWVRLGLVSEVRGCEVVGRRKDLTMAMEGYFLEGRHFVLVVELLRLLWIR